MHVLAIDFEKKSATTLSSLLYKNAFKTQKTVKVLNPESIFEANKAFLEIVLILGTPT